MLQFFEDIGLPITEGYGLTETSPVVTCSATNWKYRRLGCAGVPLSCCQVIIRDVNTNVYADIEMFFMKAGRGAIRRRR